MPLTPPVLDDRTYDDLKREALLRIARYNSAWTDFNESDPGTTLVELFAWLTEMMLYRMNKVPELNYLKFLQLLGLELRTAQAAVAELTFTPQKPGTIVTVPAGTQVGAQADDGSLKIFETEVDLDAIAAPLSQIQVFDGAAFTSVLLSNQPTDQPYWPFGFQPQAGNALYLGFDVANGVDPTRPPPQLVFPPLMRFRVFLTTDTKAVRADICRSDDPPLPTPPVKLVWEYKAKAGPDWRPLRTISDDSIAFTREGDIVVEGPANLVATVEGNQTIPAGGGKPVPHYWLRVRIAEGSYPAGKEPQIDCLLPNTVAASNLSTVRFEQVGTSDGRPKQSFRLAQTPIFPGTLRLAVQADASTDEWNPVDDFFQAGSDDPVYTLTLATGEIRFGDGVHGRVPPPGAALVAQQYRYGGGSDGNVGAGQIKAPLTNLVGLEVQNKRPAAGGRDEQSLDELREQAPSQLRCRNRAVTRDDFRALAVQAGGVARAEVFPLSHPDFPDPAVKIPGVVTVVIVPDTAEANPSPSQDLILSVCKWLNQFRLITTEMYVKKPTYIKVSVKAAVQADPQKSANQVRQAILDALNTYLDPLGRSWTDGKPGPVNLTAARAFGQIFYVTRLFAVIQDVSGVLDVPALEVTACGQPLTAKQDRCGDGVGKTSPAGSSGQSLTATGCLVPPPDGLLYGADHQITMTAADQTSTARCRRCL